jgi:oxalate decarboxylase/phosphoglucose isomerase-like protein (cupin superfamily)
MENFCRIGKLERKSVDGISEYDVCRGEKQKGNLRYDLTLIYPKRLGRPACAGRELPRTFGHYHAKGQVELFEIISGRTLFFMQRYENNPRIIKEAYLVEADEKEKVIILPDFSVTSMNPQKKKISLTSNWINIKVKNDYKFFENLKGNCYYIVEDKNKNITFKKNGKYQKIPKLILLKPKKLSAELRNLDFLNNPKKYKKFLTVKNCYKKI